MFNRNKRIAEFSPKCKIIVNDDIGQPRICNVMEAEIVYLKPPALFRHCSIVRPINLLAVFEIRGCFIKNSSRFLSNDLVSTPALKRIRWNNPAGPIINRR